MPELRHHEFVPNRHEPNVCDTCGRTILHEMHDAKPEDGSDVVWVVAERTKYLNDEDQTFLQSTLRTTQLHLDELAIHSHDFNRAKIGNELTRVMDMLTLARRRMIGH